MNGFRVHSDQKNGQRYITLDERKKDEKSSIFFHEYYIKLERSFPLESISKMKEFQLKKPLKVVFSGFGISGSVAHVAAFLMREILTKNSVDFSCGAITFSSPSFIMSCDSSFKHISCSKNHLNIISKGDISLAMGQISTASSITNFRFLRLIWGREKDKSIN